MVHIYVDKTIGKIILETDDPSVKYFLETSIQERKFVPHLKGYGNVKTTHRIYDNKRVKPDKVTGNWKYIIGLGWAAYLINVFKGHISREDFDNICKDAIYSDSYRTFPFKELRDYQNEDVLHVLKYRIGLFSCYTSYGKTQTIATIANYAYGLGKKVLLVTPGKKAQDELVKRCKTVFNLDVPSKDNRLDCVITSGLMNRKDIKDPDQRKNIIAWLGEFDWVLADEVEYTINDSGDFIYSNCINATNLYGFSGTADKSKGEMISFINGLSETVIRNKDLIKYFGPSLVYRMPMNIEIDNIIVKTTALDKIKFNNGEFSPNSNVYMNVLTTIWTTPEVCQIITKLIKKYPMLFIPINNLASILTEWIQNHWLGKFRILLVCFEGYVYYDIAGNKTILNLTEACDYIKNGKVDVIPSTSSGYRALDLPGIENILLVEGLKAGVVLQSIGRVARGKHMNIISLDSISGKKIPIYSNGNQERQEMFTTYYKYCKVNDIIINELQLN